MKNSKVFNLNWGDLGKGLLIAFLTAFLGGILELLQTGVLPVTWTLLQPILEISLAAGVSYLLKNLFTNSQGDLGKNEAGRSILGGKAKIAILLPFLMLFSSTMNAQSPWRGFTHKITTDVVADSPKALLSGTYLFRLDVGLTCPSFGFATNDEGKIIGTEGRDFSKLFAGLLFTHVRYDGFRDWGIGGGVTIPYAEGKYGIAVLGGYSIFRVGVNYDFGLPAADGISFLGGITVDIFNLTE